MAECEDCSSSPRGGSRSGSTCSPASSSHSGELQRMVERGLRSPGSRRTRRSSRRRSPAAATTTRRSASSSARPTTRARSSSRSRSRTCATPCDVLRPVWERTNGLDGYVSLEVDPGLAFDTRRDLEQAVDLHGRGRAATTSTSRSRRPPRACPRSRTASRSGISINVTLIFSLERYREVVAAYLRGLGAAQLERRRPSKVTSVASFFVSPRRHRGRRAARGARQRRAAGQARDREREARLQALPGGVQRRRSGRPRRARARRAAAALGVDLDEEPRVPRRDVRRGADRPRHRQHDAARDVAGVRGPRRGARRHGARGRRRRRSAARPSSPRPASTTTRSSRTLEAEGVQKFADSFDELIAGIEAQRGELAAHVTTERRELVARIWSRDPTVWTGTRRGALARLARRAVAHARRRRAVPAPRARTSSATPRRSCCSAWAARRSRRRCCRTPSASRRFHVLDTTHPGAIRAARGGARPRAHALRLARRSRARRSRRARTPTTSGSSRRRGEQWAAITDPGSALAALAREREFAAVFPGEPTIGGRYSALSPFGLVPGGAARRRPRAAARPGASRWPTPAASTTATRASSSASRSARAGSDGPRQGLPARTPAASASGSSS